MAIQLSEFHSMPRPDKVFNLLFLDEGEFLISSVSCRLTSPEYESETGKLHLCTRSIIFQPHNANLPLLRFKLSNPDFKYCLSLASPSPFHSARQRPASFHITSPKTSGPKTGKSAFTMPGFETPPPSAVMISVSRFEVITRDPCGPRFTQPAKDSFAFELSPHEVARVSTELETIVRGEDEKSVAQVIYSVRYKEYTAILGDTDDFDPEEFLLHHKVSRLLPEGIQLGAFVLTQSSFHFYPLVNAKPSEQVHVIFKGVNFAMRFTYLQEPVGVQVFLYSSPWPVVLIFETEEKRENIYSFLQNRVKFHNPIDELPRVTEMWTTGKMSNFNYLTFVNSVSGRTVMDLSQYPVFPWVIRNYHGEEIDLSDSRNYRDLSKPIGALNSDRLGRLQVCGKQTGETPRNWRSHV